MGIVASPYLDPFFVWVTLIPTLLLSLLRPKCLLLALCLMGAGLRANQEVRPPVILDDGYARRVVAVLEGPPEWRDPGYHFDVDIRTLDGQPWRGRARLSFFPHDDKLDKLFRNLGLGTGDRVEVLTRLRPPRSYRNPGVFDYRRYLARQGIFWAGSIRNPRLIQVLNGSWHGEDRLRKSVTERIGRFFEADETIRGLVLGMVLGQRRRLPADDVRRFQAAGLIHLLVVSGFNLAVVAATALWLGRRLRFGRFQRAGRYLFALVAILTYAALVDGQSPVVRATLMASILILGKLLDRGYTVGNALAASAILILIADPSALEDSSFQLTFAAVLAIQVLGSPLIRWCLGWLRLALRDFSRTEPDMVLPSDVADWRVSRRLRCELGGWPHRTITLPWTILTAFAETALVTLCVQLVLTGFMVESFHLLSPVTVPLNVVGAAVAAIITPLGLLLILLPHFAGLIVARLMSALLHFLILSVDLGLRVPGASFRVPSPPGEVWAIYALTVLAFMFSIRRRSPRAALLSLAAAYTLQALIVIADFDPVPPRHTTVTFLDVGQGDSSLVELTDGTRVLIDAGGSATARYRSADGQGTFSVGEDVLTPYLFSRGIRHLDVVALTHAHHDHMGGLFDLIRNFRIGEIWLGRNPMTVRYRELLQEAYEHQIPIRWLRADDRIKAFEVLNPPRDWKAAGKVKNDDSLVLLLRTEDGSAFLTGDLERSIPAPDLVDVLKVPHHGSKNTSLKVRALIPVISVGANNPFRHPHPTKLPALRTDILGAIQVVLTPDGPVVSFPGLKEK